LKRDSTYLTKVIITIFVSVLVVVIFVKGGERARDQASDPSAIAIDMKLYYLLLFVASIELSLLSFISTGCIFRVAEEESRISYFLYASKGNRLSYIFANYIYDISELLLTATLTMLGTKLIVFGRLGLGLGSTSSSSSSSCCTTSAK
jgi:heme/copper-type cytochrome/quinol oxidase subunit 2